MLRWYHLIGISLAITLNILVILTIYIPASYNPKGMVCISTNTYGEHWLEFIYISIGFLTFMDFLRINYDVRKNEESAKLLNQQKIEN